jgi:mannose-6-phosphate isomerase-like protein (cupin superfamily)
MSDSLPLHSSESLGRALRNAKLSVADLWLTYFSLGGKASQGEIERYLAGDESIPVDQADVLAAALVDHGATIDGYEFALRGRAIRGTARTTSTLQIDEVLANATSAVWIGGGGHAIPLAAEGTTQHPPPLTDDGHLVRLDSALDERWELHPAGDEVVHLLAGSLKLSLDSVEGRTVSDLEPGQMALVPQNTWHQHVSNSSGSVLFVTPMLGTEREQRA